MMPVQRTRDAESRVRNKLSNGPLRVQSNAFYAKYSATCWHTSVAGNMLVFRKGQRILFQIIFAVSVLLGFAGKFSLKQGGTADNVSLYSSLTESDFCQGLFL